MGGASVHRREEEAMEADDAMEILLSDCLNGFYLDGSDG